MTASAATATGDPSHPRRLGRPGSAREPVEATVALPGSKSLTNRYLVLAALACDRSRLRQPLRSRDTLLMAEALRALGRRDRRRPGAPHGRGCRCTRCPPVPTGWSARHPARRGLRVDVGLAGTVMRFLPPVAALADGRSSSTATRRHGYARWARWSTRCARSGSPSTTAVAAPPGRRRRHRFGPRRLGDHGRASASSQFVSALLLAGARYDEGVTVHHDGKPVPSEPHIAMTVETLRDAGVVVDDAEPNTWRVEPCEINAARRAHRARPLQRRALPRRGPRRGRSGPGAGLAAAHDAGRRPLREILDAMGADVSLDRKGLTVTGTGELVGIDVDLHDAS